MSNSLIKNRKKIEFETKKFLAKQAKQRNSFAPKQRNSETAIRKMRPKQRNSETAVLKNRPKQRNSETAIFIKILHSASKH